MDYTLIRSRRKTISIQVTPAGELVVRCPKTMSRAAIHSFLESKRAWIEKHLEKAASASRLPPFTQQELGELTLRAKQILSQRAAYFAPLAGVDYGRITVRSQRSRWGSCSGKGNLNFNCLLVLTPPAVLDYVVVHELCHRKEMNHAPRFWAEVERILPDYREAKKWLKDHGTELIGRIPEKK